MPLRIPFGLEGVFAQMFGRAVGEVAQAQSNPLMRSVLIWVSTVQTHVVERWQPIVASGIRCALRPKMADGRFGPCTEPAIGACGFCSAPTCLAHAMIDSQANILCYKCLAEAAKLMGAPARRSTEAPPPGAAPGEKAEERAKRRKYLHVLGLVDPVTDEEIAQEFRTLMKKHHPDRAPEHRKEAARKKAAAISEAYHWLNDDRRRKVA
jgi:DnaJ domain